MKVLVINSGSSSIKFKLFNMDKSQELGSGLIEQIGEPSGAGKFEYADQEISVNQEIKNHNEALKIVTDMLLKSGLISSFDELDAVGHRVVQGGDIFKGPTLLTKDLGEKINELSALAPLHNPAHYAGIKVIFDSHPNIPQVAVFDTSFHQTMPPKAFMYALPYEIYEKHKVRKYGFHGTSHLYVSRQAAKFLNKDINSFNAITFHLGNGSSITAIENGKCVDTSMGLTPLEGVMMGTRTGSMDPEVVLFLQRKGYENLSNLLNKQSGFKGICGANDLRQIIEMSQNGDEKAQLVLDMFSYHLKRFLGSYYAVLGRVDAIVFTGGIGENASIIRQKVCENLQSLGIEMDIAKNNERSKDQRDISTPNSKVKILVTPTNEELEIAVQTKQVLGK